jgi:hypothetical protein
MKAGEGGKKHVKVTSVPRQGHNVRLLIRSRVRFLDLYQERTVCCLVTCWYVSSGWPEDANEKVKGLTCEERKTDITFGSLTPLASVLGPFSLEA